MRTRTLPGNIHRFFAPDLAAAEIPAAAAEAHHAAGVLRLKAGEIVELFDGRGGVATGPIVRIGRGEMIVAAQERKQLHRAGPAVCLGFAVPKGKRLDWLLEKATELGAAALQPVIFERSVAGGDEMTESKSQKWLVHCLAAAKQCGLNFLPELRPPLPLSQFLASATAATSLNILGDLGERALGMKAALERRGPGQDICLLVGPEGDLTDAERQSAVAAGFLPVRLGHTVLRVETAAVALLSAVMAMCE
ncbi:MAG: 16S rRNA (uracil(1498)-N(3))-methyltransferase [Phycisphaerae bacterium]|jgi:16S rRNA (uracil1498-N3)-methyltransferase